MSASRLRRNELTIEEVKHLFDYTPETGELTWRVTLNSRSQVGMIAGGIHPSGYRRIGIGRRLYAATRIIWLWMTGENPPRDVDHENTIRGDNRWVNLRLATKAQNQANTGLRKANKSGFKGVHFVKGAGKWCAQIREQGHIKTLGLFDSKEDGAQAYRAAAIEIHGEFARV